jgi:GntR family transcriptional regulator
LPCTQHHPFRLNNGTDFLLKNIAIGIKIIGCSCYDVMTGLPVIRVFPRVCHDTKEGSADMMMKLDKRSSQPLYAQLKELLIERIRLGQYQPGQQIPSELALCEELDLSRPTVRQAIAEMVSEGALVIVKGKGTYVSAEPERTEIKGFNPFTFSFLSLRSLDNLQLHVETIPGDLEMIRLFGPGAGSVNPDFWSIQWVIEDQGQTFVVCHSLIPVVMFPELGAGIQQKRRMLEIMANKYAYLPQKASCQIFVRPASSEEARQLDISRSAPVLVASSRLVSRSSNICEIATAVLRADLVIIDLEAGRS